ncbi:MAG: hypothetical protein DHS20C09_04520 [marine bacterium B5-7]|nr:MAG: hypothetical protein DHS20C09_04520 [marine bacterium B5-7]
MVQVQYGWEDGAVLGEHSKKKHSVLRNYFYQYLITRCAQIPQQERFRLAVIDGFSGAGVYDEGHIGSPLIFVQTLNEATKFINLHRLNNGFKPIEIECLLVLNDAEPGVTELLQTNIAPSLLQAAEESRNLKVVPKFYKQTFESLYPSLRHHLLDQNTSNVFFNLDQCGYKWVPTEIIKNIMGTWKNAEIFLTFMIRSALTYLTEKNDLAGFSNEPEVKEKIKAILDDETLMNRKEWLGEAEKIIYNNLMTCAPYVSPFSINNPDGWRYWLMHFANSYRARQVYNNLLHEDSETQAHFGKPGLNMLSYDPLFDKTQLYLFDNDSRIAAKDALNEDIPRLIAHSGDALLMGDFYASAYSGTPAHSDDIHSIIIESQELEVVTQYGGVRRKANTIKPSDILKLKSQRSFFFSSK